MLFVWKAEGLCEESLSSSFQITTSSSGLADEDHELWLKAREKLKNKNIDTAMTENINLLQFQHITDI